MIERHRGLRYATKTLAVLFAVSSSYACADDTGGSSAGGSSATAGSGGGGAGGGAPELCAPHILDVRAIDACHEGVVCDLFVQGTQFGWCTASCGDDSLCSPPTRCTLNEFGTGSCLLPCNDGACPDGLACADGVCKPI